MVTICTASLTFSSSTFCPHSVFVCFVWISEQTAIISLYNINWLVFITQTQCVYCAVRTGSLIYNSGVRGTNLGTVKIRTVQMAAVVITATANWDRQNTVCLHCLHCALRYSWYNQNQLNELPDLNNDRSATVCWDKYCIVWNGFLFWLSYTTNLSVV